MFAPMKIQFRLKYESRWGENLFLAGNEHQAGCWNPQKAFPMKYARNSIWEAELDIENPISFEYKYIIIEDRKIIWEQGRNRNLANQTGIVNDYFRKEDLSDTVLHSKPFRSILHEWDGQGWGVAVPVFSLRTNEDSGIGEFNDLKKLGDWCKSWGMQIIQILPINDTTAQWNWKDSYPYNAISAFALNPIYLNLNDLGIDEHLKEPTPDLEEHIDFPIVQKRKWDFFRIAYQKHWETTRNSNEFIAFFKENETWLRPYAAFCHLRDLNHTTDFHQWGDYSSYNESLIHSLTNENADEIGLYYFLQYHLDKQLRNAIAYLHSLGIAIKGDIPIGVNPHSVETWTRPDLFNLNGQAGAPPDAFAEEGQNWGFPTYNWEAMSTDRYQWWRERLQHMTCYFDAYRIDHILGFFRIWEIPQGKASGLEGHFRPALPLSKADILNNISADSKQQKSILESLFLNDPSGDDKYHPRIDMEKAKEFLRLSAPIQQTLKEIHDDFFYQRHNEFWKHQAAEKLSVLIQSTDMMVCGEDLGMIPKSVPDVMKSLGILSLEVQRMPKNIGEEFVSNERIPYFCVYTTGTHDMPTLRGWLTEDTERTQRFLSQLGLEGQTLTPDTLKDIITKHLQSRAIWKIYPLQDLLDLKSDYWSESPIDDQINIPSNPDNQWKYRMKPTLEQLIQDYPCPMK